MYTAFTYAFSVYFL